MPRDTGWRIHATHRAHAGSEQAKRCPRAVRAPRVRAAHFIMQRRMLLGVKERVEKAS